MDPEPPVGGGLRREDLLDRPVPDVVHRGVVVREDDQRGHEPQTVQHLQPWPLRHVRTSPPSNALNLVDDELWT